MKKLLFISLMLLFLSATNAQTEAVKVTALKGNEYGLTYSLPKTMLNVDVQVTKITQKRGQFYQYAEKYLGVKDVITEDKTYWTLDNIDVWGKSVIDKDNTYFIQLKSNAAPFMYLTADGVICSINTEPDFSDVPKTHLSVEKPAAAAIIDKSSVMTEELLMASSTSKMAEIAAKQIYRIRESRMNILTGDADKIPGDGESFKLVISQLEAQEKALTEMFTGTITKESKMQSYLVEPEDVMNNFIVCRFSQHLGLVGKDDLSGIPVFITTKKTSEGENVFADTKQKSQKGIVCNTPGEASVKVTFSNKTYFDSTLKIAQFGSLTVLPSTIFEDKKNPAKVIFYPDLGAVKKILQ